MELDLEGKTALVSGGSHGIGEAIVKSLRSEKVKVDIMSRSMGLKFDVMKDDFGKLI